MNFGEIAADYGLAVAYILLGICALGVIIFPIIQSVSNPKILIKPLIGVVAIAALFFLFRSMDTSGISSAYYPLVESWPELSTEDAEVRSLAITHNVGAALIVTYILGAISVLGIFVTELSKYFR